MNTLAIDRRHLLKLGISSTVAFALPACITREDEQMRRWLEPVSDVELPVNETRTGTLDDGAFEALAGLCRYVDRVWELGSDMPSYLERLRADLEFKTKEQPSYLTEYEHAIELIEAAREPSAVPQRVESSGGLAEQTRGASRSKTGPAALIDVGWEALLFAAFPEAESESFAHTKLGRARRWVFAEILTHQIPISGAFKSFGLLNYTGYFGGAYTDPTSYRRADTQ